MLGKSAAFFGAAAALALANQNSLFAEIFLTAKANRVETMDENVKRIVDHIDIISLVNRFFMSVDERDYAVMKNCLTERVEFDYSRLFGTKMPPTAGGLVENVRQNHAGLRATQHLTANHTVTISGDRAECTANFQAQHFLPNERGTSLWMVAGRYKFALTRTSGGWKIRGCTIFPTWTDGNLNIFDLAHEQAKNNRKN